MRTLNVVLALVAGMGLTLEASAQQTVTLTSTEDLQRGNNEGLTSAAQDRLTRDAISAGTLGSWSAERALPSARYGHTVVIARGFLHIIGGADATFAALGETRYASVQSDGSLGQWLAGAELPTPRFMHSSAAYNGFLYAIGGNGEGFVPLDDVSVAPLNADGSAGSWSSVTALPSARYGQGSTAYNGFLYSVGGAVNGDPEAIDEVLVAPLNADGSIGSWSVTTPLPSARVWLSTVAYGGFLYVIGGYDGFNSQADVLAAPINDDGTLGEWSTAGALSAGRHALAAFAHNGFLYAVGGIDPQGNQIDEVASAAVNPNGSLGGWAALTALPVSRVGHASVAFNGFVYTLGGFDPSFTFLDEVLSAPINPDDADANQQPGRLRGIYSHLVDLQADVSNRYVILNGFLTEGGGIRLQARVAPDATGVFSAETVIDSAPMGAPIQIPGDGRHVWIRITLDDTGATNALAPSYLTDITVTPTEPPGAGTVFDGPGADIDSQTSTSTIEANWSGFTASPGDPISFYEWAIGTAPGLTNVQGWVSVGPATSATNSSLTLGTGTKFVSVRATSLSGLTSAAATSDGVQILPVGGATGSDDDRHGRCSNGAAPGSGAPIGVLAALVLGLAFLARGK